MKRVVFDLETNGLLDTLTEIHCLVLRDLDTNEVLSCTDSAPGYTSLAEGLAVLAAADVAYAHNGIGFDVPAIQKLHPTFRLKAVCRDTFIIAAMRWAHIKDDDYAQAKVGKFPMQLAGRHSLEAWGHRLGKPKVDYPGWCKAQGVTEWWAKWTPEMQEYCIADTDTTASLVRHIRDSGISPEAVDTELRLREYLVQQEANGWPFDMDGAIALQATLADRRTQLDAQLRETFGSWQVSLGMFTPKVNNKTRGYVKGVPVEQFKTVEFNPGSRAHIADRLITLYGWEPEEYTDGGQAKVDETTLASLTYPPVPALIEYLLIEKRLGQLSEGKEGWLRHAKPNATTQLSHIHHRVLQSGTITHRAAHNNPNLGQVPKVGSKYGAECRALFTVPVGWKQVGADASGLEARCLGHYVARYDGGAYAKLLLEGDVHTANRIALGLPDGVDEDGKKYRDRAKTWYYAWLFGAGDEKLGKILSPKTPKRWKKLGAEAKVSFLKNTPALALLIKDVQAAAAKDGYVKSLDGRRVYVRSQHAALNTLIQSAGAVICKKWIVDFSATLTADLGPQGWDGEWAALGWIHDEVQLAVRPDLAPQVCTTLVAAMQNLTAHFSFRCPLTGEAKVGNNWRDTH